MKKKIAILTDFSSNAWNTLHYAGQLYKSEEVDFYIINAFMVDSYATDSMMVPEPGEKYYDIARNRSEEGLRALQTQLEELEVSSNHNYFTESVFNEPLEAIKQIIADKDIELVIIGNKGQTDDQRIFLGSNCIQFMEHIRNCPVLMIPNTVTFTIPNEIVFPTSFKTHFKRRELLHLQEIARITKAPIRVLHINEASKLSQEQLEKKELLQECFEDLQYSFHYLDQVDVITGLNIFTQSRNSGMIAFINKKHRFFGFVFSKPMVKDLGYTARVPVLVMHDFRN
ncbi:universal stress protein [Leeuwenhoekiella parthenopeia]|uniref:Universal stress protein n=1 Tax=Leeuwenhoekiella parthenopeia TaxID=2890320 RepID=A0ABS8GVD6_9FLAO|nr:universal stress protein [Leeuwenhoekiella parthenopeia]MCC4213966.1 universal stress protein [Leeuwenhoekiella parthenopeia]